MGRIHAKALGRKEVGVFKKLKKTNGAKDRKPEQVRRMVVGEAGGLLVPDYAEPSRPWSGCGLYSKSSEKLGAFEIFLPGIRHQSGSNKFL